MAVTHINDESFDAAVSANVSLVDFWASWCGPCRMFGPIFEDVSAKFPNVNFYKFEVDESNRRAPAKYGIRSIPAVLAFKDGELVETKTGLMSEDALEEWVKGLI